MRVCTICRHPRRVEIDRDLLNRIPYRKLEAQYKLSRSAIGRHLQHVSTALRQIAAAEHRQITAAEPSVADAAAIVAPVLGEMRKLNARALRILGDAEAAEDRTTALHAIRECRRNLELIAKLTGELDPRAAGETPGAPLTVVVQYVDKAALIVSGCTGPTPLPEAQRLNAPRAGANTEAS